MRGDLVRRVSRPSVLWAGLFLGLLAPPDAMAQSSFLRGDVNGDGQVSMADTSMWGCILFCLGVEPYSCIDAADVNDNGIVDLVDLVVFLDHLYSNRDYDPGIAPPFPAIGPDPTDDDLTCTFYEPTPPAAADDSIQLGSIPGSPGEQVLVPVYLTTAVRVNAIQFIVQYDPQVFAPLVEGSDEEKAELYYAGTDVESVKARNRFVSWRDDAASGILRFGQSIDLTGAATVGPGELIHVGNIPGTVLPETAHGSTIELRLVDQVTLEGTFHNEVSAQGSSRIVTQTRSGSIAVEQGFLRGDANIDGTLDLSDAIRILSVLFVGEGTIDCADAADVNDDAIMDISDAIAHLTRLFLGDPTPAPPPSVCGADPTADQLDCSQYSHCL